MTQLAEELNMSVSGLTRSFLAGTGVTPITFLKERRLEEAGALLERGEFNVSDVATILGFSDLSAFNKAFKRKFEIAPSAYKASVSV